MPIIIPTIPFIGGRRKRPGATQEAPAAPVLASASFGIDDGAYLTLGFDRAVSLAGVDLSAITVADQPDTSLFGADSWAMLDAVTVRLEMSVIDSCPDGPDYVLDATAANGIVSVDGAIAWAGASGVVLPFA